MQRLRVSFTALVMLALAFSTLTRVAPVSASTTFTVTTTDGLPEITDPVIIDGYTQPGASPNTLAPGDNAVLLIEIDEGHSSRLTISAGGSTVRGLIINRGFPYGLYIY